MAIKSDPLVRVPKIMLSQQDWATSDATPKQSPQILPSGRLSFRSIGSRKNSFDSLTQNHADSPPTQETHLPSNENQKLPRSCLFEATSINVHEKY